MQIAALRKCTNFHGTTDCVRSSAGAAFSHLAYICKQTLAGSVHPTILSSARPYAKRKMTRVWIVTLFFFLPLTSRYLRSQRMLSGPARAKRVLCDLTRTSNRNDGAPDVNNRRNSLELRRRR